jgi:proline dehydrogenase
MSIFSRMVIIGMPLVPKFVVRHVASRYVAGETANDALTTVRELNAQGAMATLDLLGEEVTEKGKALEATDEYVRLIAAIHRDGLDANVSIKLTMLGLKIDPAFCRDNVDKIAAAAKSCGNFVRIDMEDATTTDATLAIYRELHARYGNLGCVLQAYMRRTLRDVVELPRERPNVRLCKGIYIEPRRVAWKGYDTVRLNFIQALEALIDRGVYTAIATHDEYLTCASTAVVHRRKLRREQYEFQMLLGVDPELRGILLEQGHRVRVYVPYGRDWYPYSIRRLRENPEVAKHVMRAFLGLR